jgi:hypothetical protein
MRKATLRVPNYILQNPNIYPKFPGRKKLSTASLPEEKNWKIQERKIGKLITM